MAGPNLELVKFGMYVFFPIAIMVHYGDPDWYRKYVLPDKSQFLRLDKMAPSPPRNKTELQQELDHMKQLREERKQIKSKQPASVPDQVVADDRPSSYQSEETRIV